MSRKVKYDYEFKLRCVNEVLKTHKTISFVSLKNKIEESNLRRWIGFYQKYGAKGLIPRKNQRYSIEFKLKVLQSLEKEFLSLLQACLKFDIPSGSTILKWQKDFNKQGLKGLILKPRGRQRIVKQIKKQIKPDKILTREEELLLENKILRAENALLKKLQALIQAEENKQRKP